MHRVLVVLGLFAPGAGCATRRCGRRRPPSKASDADVVPAQVRSDSSDTYWKITGGPPADGLGAVVESFAVRASATLDDVQDGGAVEPRC